MPHKTFRSVTEAAADDIFDIVIVCSKNIPEVEPIEELISPIVMKNSNEAPLVILFQNGTILHTSVISIYFHLICYVLFV